MIQGVKINSMTLNLNQTTSHWYIVWISSLHHQPQYCVYSLHVNKHQCEISAQVFTEHKESVQSFGDAASEKEMYAVFKKKVVSKKKKKK